MFVLLNGIYNFTDSNSKKYTYGISLFFGFWVRLIVIYVWTIKTDNKFVG